MAFFDFGACARTLPNGRAAVSSDRGWVSWSAYADADQAAACERRSHLRRAPRPFFDAVASFLGDRRIRGTLPGTATFKERAQRSIAAIERNWLIKTVAILAALAAATVSFVQLYRFLQN